MTRTKTLIVVLLTLFVASLPTLAQSTLGNMFKLGGSTTAGLPASSTYTVGALIYDLDAGQPLYNNGSAWQSLVGSSSGGSYWSDAGVNQTFGSWTTNLITTAETPRLTGNGDLFPYASTTYNGNFIFKFDGTAWKESPGVVFTNSTDTLSGSIRGGGYANGVSTYSGMNFHTHANGDVRMTFANTHGTNTVFDDVLYGQFMGNGVSGQSGLYLSGAQVYSTPNFDVLWMDTGARLHMGGGTNDYFVSNGTGIATPGYFRVGNFNDAGIPSPSSVPGAIAYNTSQGAPVWSDGTSWQTFGSGAGGGSGSGGYWLDGGAGTMYNETPIAKPFDGGWALRVYNQGGQDALEFYPSSQTSGAYATILMTAQTYADYLWTGTLNLQGNNVRVLSPGNATAYTTGFGSARKTLMVQNNARGGISSTQLGAGLSISSGSAGDMTTGTEYGALLYGLPYQGTGYSGFIMQAFQGVPLSLAASAGSGMTDNAQLQLNSSGIFTSYQSSGNTAFAMNTTGARIDLGAGTNDYCVSDGFGIVTPSYWESTRAYSSGAGIIANSMTCSAQAPATFTFANNSTQAFGTVSTDIALGTVSKRRDSSVAPIAQHVIFDEQTYTSRIPASGNTGEPDFAEHVPLASGEKLLKLQWSGVTASANTLEEDRRSYFPMTRTGEGSAEAFSIESSTPGTLAFFIDSEASPSFCQRLRTDTSSVANQLVWVGLMASRPDGSTTLTGRGAAFRYAASTDTNWQLCSSTGGGSQSCLDTGIAVVIKTTYVLCFKASLLDGATYAYVDGNYVGSLTSNLITSANAPLGYDLYLRNFSSSANINVGPFHIGGQ